MATRSARAGRGHRLREMPVDRRLAAIGLVAGAAVGAWAGGRVRSAVGREPAPGLIDWDRARAVAIQMNRTATLTATERERLDAYYRALGARCVPVVAAYVGTELPPTVERTYAFDRVDWINANLTAFRMLFAPLEDLRPEHDGASIAAALWGGVNQQIVGLEVGVLLGYLARRVLGQYDLALLGREPVTSGKLYYVEPNIRAVERMLGLPSDDFRTWLALHETTHAFEFEAHPWVRDHFNGLLGRYMETLKQDAEHLKRGVRGLRVFADRIRDREGRGEAWIEALMTPEQRALFGQMQAMMCVVEGYSNHVMNAVGRDLLPTYEEIARKFERRQRQRTGAERLFARLTGLDVKLEQYRLGQAFVDRVAAERGHAFARRVWDGPDYLPTMVEIREPERWMARLDARDREPTEVAALAP